MMERQHSWESSWDSFFVRIRKRATNEASTAKKAKRKVVPTISGGRLGMLPRSTGRRAAMAHWSYSTLYTINGKTSPMIARKGKKKFTQ